MRCFSRRIAIFSVCIILLIAILFVFGRIYHNWREEADSEMCKRDMLSLYKYLVQYALEHGDKLPSTSGEFWFHDASNYMKTYAILKCPKDKGMNKTSYLLVPQAAGKRLDFLQHKVILLENSPRHNGVAHAVLGGGKVIDVKGVLIKNYR